MLGCLERSDSDKPVLRIRDPVPFLPLDPGSGAFFTPGSGIRDGYKKRMRFRDPRMEKIRIRDGKHSDPGSGINIPDPQHSVKHKLVTKRKCPEG
jgi:hypothetical protein